MKKDLNDVGILKKKSMDFINSAISCNCLVLLKNLGVLDALIKGNSVSLSMLSDPGFCANYVAAYSSLTTLEKSGVVERAFDKFNMTDFGCTLSEYIGLITMLFDGYGLLMAEQRNISKNKIKDPFKLMRIDSIIESSVQFGKDTVDPLIKDVFSRIKTTGTICDLGCGLGTRLGWVCKETGNPGLGLENDDGSVLLAREKFKEEPLVSFEKGDISKLDGIWEDITVLMQCFVFHDFVKTKECVSIINSYIKNFPNIKYFVYVDIVSPSDSKKQILPGYDYVHGLLGIETPTYEEIIELFTQSDYQIIEEISVPDLPNTFIWILSPRLLGFL